MAIKAKAKVNVDAPVVETPAETPVVEAPKTIPNKVTPVRSREDFLDRGRVSLSTLGEKEKELIGSKSNTLKCERFIGISTIKGKRKDKSGPTVECVEPQAGEFISTVEVKVPRIDVRYDITKGYDPEKISHEVIPAGEKFTLTQAEAAIFLAAPEYSYLCTYKEVPNGLRIGLRTDTLLKGESKFPTPSFEFTSNAGQQYGAPKALVETIDTVTKEVVEGKEVIHVTLPDEYARFRPLVEKRKVSGTGSVGKKSGNKEQISHAILAASVREIFNLG